MRLHLPPPRSVSLPAALPNRAPSSLPPSRPGAAFSLPAAPSSAAPAALEPPLRGACLPAPSAQLSLARAELVSRALPAALARRLASRGAHRACACLSSYGRPHAGPCPPSHSLLTSSSAINCSTTSNPENVLVATRRLLLCCALLLCLSAPNERPPCRPRVVVAVDEDDPTILLIEAIHPERDVVMHECTARARAAAPDRADAATEPTCGGRHDVAVHHVNDAASCTTSRCALSKTFRTPTRAACW
jgi:hypothetical protein